MSRVTGVVLSADCVEDDNILDKINKYLLGQRAGWRLNAVEDYAGGSKHPQIHLFCGGLNHFHDADRTAFIELIESFDWQIRAAVILLFYAEEAENVHVHRLQMEKP